MKATEILENKAYNLRQEEKKSFDNYHKLKKEARTDMRYIDGKDWFWYWLDYLQKRNQRRQAQIDLLLYSVK